MIKTTFITYRENFKEFIGILKPLIIIELLIAVIGILTNIFTVNQNLVGVILFTILLIVLSLIQWLIYTPAAFRTIQKRELGEKITVDEAITVQKNDKWNYFMLMVWTGLYSIFFGILTFVPMLIGGTLGFYMMTLGPIGVIIGFLVMVAGVSAGLYYGYMNFSKLFFPLSIYVVKNSAPRDAVRESISIGKTHRNEVWKYIVGILVINIIGFLIVIIPLLFNLDIVLSEAEPPLLFATVAAIWQVMIGVLFVTPLTFLYISKAYAKIRTRSDVVIPQATIAPEIVK